jgi:conjugative relaxase-like TrwC/TraI family protein
VLSIGKLGRGQEGYYLQAVARGVEDYYLGSAEAPGRWIGGGCGGLGLSGRVGPDALRAVLDARSPADRQRSLISHRRPDRLPGYDLTFSAPKGVSLLFALGGPELMLEVRRAHDAAVAAALGYLEREAGEVRRGKDGISRLPGGGFVAAAFRHRTSRAGDPQLHTHVLVANMTRGADGRYSALDGQQLYAQAKTAGTLYQAALRHELRELGLAWAVRDNGLAEPAGVPHRVLRAFSRRRVEIEQAMAEYGSTSRAGAQVAALATRKAKDYGVHPESLAAEWHARADALGFDARARARLLARLPARLPEPTDLLRASADLLSPAGLTARASTFSRPDAIRGWCVRLTHGAPVAEVEALADRLLVCPEVVALGASAGRLTAGAVPGGAARNARRYTTGEMLATEVAVLTAAAAGRGAGVCLADPDDVAVALADRELSAEQQALVRRVASSGAGVEVVIGRAGSGKTSALAAAAAAWRAGGVPVLGAAVAARAALAFGEQAGVPAMTVTRLLAALDKPVAGRSAGLARGSVLIVDEAGMLGTRPLARLLAHVRAADAKLVLVGDHRQLPELEAGGALCSLARTLGAIELSQNRRQTDAWERAALDQLRDGDPTHALQAYEAAGRVQRADNGADARAALAASWWQASTSTTSGVGVGVGGPSPQVVMLAVRRTDVDELNLRARIHMRAAGLLTGASLTVPVTLYAERTFTAGDLVIARRNDYRRGLINGQRGIVTAVEPDRGTLTVRIGGRELNVDACYLRNGGLDHGYAFTVHQAQGLTCERAMLLGSDALYREAGYVGLSRGRQRNDLHLVERAVPDDPGQELCHAPRRTGDEVDDALAAVRSALSRSRAQSLAHDLARR